MPLQKCRYSKNHYSLTLFSRYPNESGFYLVALTLAAAPIKGESKDMSLSPFLTHTNSHTFSSSLSLSLSLVHTLSLSQLQTYSFTIFLFFRSLPKKKLFTFCTARKRGWLCTDLESKRLFLSKKFSQLSLFKVHTHTQEDE
jgi:hypothetical protein